MPEKVEGTFDSWDGKKLFFRYFQDENPGADTLVLLHGHGEHSGRYEKFVSFLKEEHLNLAAYDLRGCGRSEGRIAYIDSMEDLFRDLDSFLAFLESRFAAGRKVLLFGHSLGGLIAFHWAQRSSSRPIKALILSSPCLGLNLPRVLTGFNAFMNRLWPGFLYQNPVYPPYLTHNLAEVDCYKKDPYIRRKISARLLSEMIKYTDLLREQDYIFPFPVYFLIAGLEKVVDRRKTERIFSRIQCPDKQLTCFEDFYHEIFNELDQNKAFDVLKKYIREAKQVFERTQ